MPNRRDAARDAHLRILPPLGTVDWASAALDRACDLGFDFAMSLQSTSDGRVVAIGGTSDGSFAARVTDNGDDWASLSLPDGIAPLALDASGDRWVMIGAPPGVHDSDEMFGQVFFADNDGSSWTEATLGWPSDAPLPEYATRSTRAVEAPASGDQTDKGFVLLPDDWSHVSPQPRVPKGPDWEGVILIVTLDDPSRLSSEDGHTWRADPLSQYADSSSRESSVVDATGTVWSTWRASDGPPTVSTGAGSRSPMRSICVRPEPTSASLSAATSSSRSPRGAPHRRASPTIPARNTRHRFPARTVGSSPGCGDPLAVGSGSFGA